MEKFSILEAQSRFYGGGNPFSNGHRSKNHGGFLEDRHVLLDLDQIVYDNNSVKYIIEKKFKAESRLGNILTTDTYQKKLLKSLCQSLGAELIIHITSENRYYDVSGDSPKLINNIGELVEGLFSYDSDDSIYIEFRNNKPVAIVKRADGNKVNNLLEIFANRLNIQIIGVQDTGSKIKFYKYSNGLTTNVAAIDNVLDRDSLTNDQIKHIENQWRDVYKILGLY